MFYDVYRFVYMWLMFGVCSMTFTGSYTCG
ncbi:hypothetical protein LEMLEM_LOCUS17034 [Lemmus lemmus]